MSRNRYINALDSVFITVFSVVFGLYFGVINNVQAVFGGESLIKNYGLIILFFVYIITMFTGYIYIIDFRDKVAEARFKDIYKSKAGYFSHLSIVFTIVSLIVLQDLSRDNLINYNFVHFYFLTLFVWFTMSILVTFLVSKDFIQRGGIDE